MQNILFVLKFAALTLPESLSMIENSRLNTLDILTRIENAISLYLHKANLFYNLPQEISAHEQLDNPFRFTRAYGFIAVEQIEISEEAKIYVTDLMSKISRLNVLTANLHDKRDWCEHDAANYQRELETLTKAMNNFLLLCPPSSAKLLSSYGLLANKIKSTTGYNETGFLPIIHETAYLSWLSSEDALDLVNETQKLLDTLIQQNLDLKQHLDVHTEFTSTYP
ncbi:hypothetical protein Lgra_3383 [Legionella gratiana]|uniref:Uncharacterized protein n=1 Tax=Legionella gratiana TaxID=45066 RepID=A0A378JEF0_9GAMM|nr:hypothetical protein [Legionella gratiana]KTD05506.1 hypothetical protein Lgra_3383 [Legionella gratiana]STX45408.1 Uncharacterised protein [Legionella gratiana]